MTPLLPTIGQDFGEVGQRSSDAALSNLLLEYHQKLHPVILTSPRPCLFLFLRHQNVSLNYRSGWWPPLSLFSSSIRRETTFANSTDINSSSEQTLSSNKIFIRTLRLIAKPLWTKGWGDKCRKKYLLSTKGIGLFVFTWVRHCSDEIVLVHKLSLILLRLPTLWGIYWAKVAL